MCPHGDGVAFTRVHAQLTGTTTTIQRTAGLDGARQEARRLVVEAKAALNSFGPKAAALLAIADYIVEREN